MIHATPGPDSTLPVNYFQLKCPGVLISIAHKYYPISNLKCQRVLISIVNQYDPCNSTPRSNAAAAEDGRPQHVYIGVRFSIISLKRVLSIISLKNHNMPATGIISLKSVPDFWIVYFEKVYSITKGIKHGNYYDSPKKDKSPSPSQHSSI